MISPDLRLETDKVLLRPLQHLDLAAFSSIATDPSVWKYLTFLLDDPQQLHRWVEIALQQR